MAGALRRLQRQIALTSKPPKDFSVLGFQHVMAHHFGNGTTALRPAFSNARLGAQCPAMHAVAADLHDHDQHEPDQNNQYCGVIVWNTSCSILNTTAPISPP
jgi:hypothetical protein